MNCPYLGTNQEKKECHRPSKNVRGLKSHLTRSHGQWTDEQIMAAVQSERAEMPSVVAEGAEPATEALALAPAVNPEPEPETEGEGKGRKRKSTVGFSKALKEAKEFICEAIPEFICSFLTVKTGRKFDLTEKAKGTIRSLWEGYFDLLGIEFENMEPLNVKVGGKKMLFLIPLGIILFTLGIATKGPKPTPKKEEKPAQQSKPKEEAAAATPAPGEDGADNVKAEVIL